MAQNNSLSNSKKAIRVGNFELMTNPSTIILPESNIDAYGGYLKYDSTEIRYSYGNYVSTNLQPRRDYLMKEFYNLSEDGAKFNVTSCKLLPNDKDYTEECVVINWDDNDYSYDTIPIPTKTEQRFYTLEKYNLIYTRQLCYEKSSNQDITVQITMRPTIQFKSRENQSICLFAKVKGESEMEDVMDIFETLNLSSIDSKE